MPMPITRKLKRPAVAFCIEFCMETFRSIHWTKTYHFHPIHTTIRLFPLLVPTPVGQPYCVRVGHGTRPLGVLHSFSRASQACWKLGSAQ